MKTFFNIAQECSNNIIIRARQFGPVADLIRQRENMLANNSRFPLHVRITRRGRKEQYNSKYLANYHTNKRLSRSHVFTDENILNF